MKPIKPVPFSPLHPLIALTALTVLEQFEVSKSLKPWNVWMDDSERDRVDGYPKCTPFAIGVVCTMGAL